MIFLTLNIFICFNNILIFLFAVSSKILYFFLSFFKILISVFPIDPVEPSITTFLIIY